MTIRGEFDTARIAVIIPCAHQATECVGVLQALKGQSLSPTEIIIVDSSGVNFPTWPNVLEKIALDPSIRVHIETVTQAYPGRARNLGRKLVSTQWIAFLDVCTIPNNDWLSDSIRMVQDGSHLGVWGSTRFEACSWMAELVRDGIYGLIPRRTLPGSLLKSSMLEAVGQFIEWTRAAEDTEWMSRAETLRLPLIDGPSGSIRYVGMRAFNLRQAIRRWFRNYTAAGELQHLQAQKIVIWVVLYAILVTFAFNWNSIAAGWQTNSPLYIDHITKIASSAPVWGYALVRGALVPYGRGVPLKRLLPIRFLFIASVCAVLDGVKTYVFLSGRQRPPQ